MAKASAALLLLALLAVLGPRGTTAELRQLHTYAQDSGVEVVTLVPVAKERLLPLLPDGYTLRPASTVGPPQAPPLGTDDQGLLGFGQFRGVNPKIDGVAKPNPKDWVSVEVFIIISPPAAAAPNGLDIANAFHSYFLVSYTNYTGFITAQKDGSYPAKKVENIAYQRDVANPDDTGPGYLTVTVPGPIGQDAFKIRSGWDDFPLCGTPFPLNVVLWHESDKGTGVVLLNAESQDQNFAVSQFYADADSTWGKLVAGGGFPIPCQPPPAPGEVCVAAPALNQRYPNGLDGWLWQLQAEGASRVLETARLQAASN